MDNCPHRGAHERLAACDEHPHRIRGNEDDCPQGCIPEFIRVTRAHPATRHLWYKYHAGKVFRVIHSNIKITAGHLNDPGYVVDGPSGEGKRGIRVADCAPCEAPTRKSEYRMLKPTSLNLIWEAAGDRTQGTNFLGDWGIFLTIISKMHGAAWPDLWGQKTFNSIMRKLWFSEEGGWPLALMLDLGFIGKKFEPIAIHIAYPIETERELKWMRMYGKGVLGTSGENAILTEFKRLVHEAMKKYPERNL